MEKSRLSLSVQCPNHEMIIGMLNPDLTANKIGYCYECLAENGKDGCLLQTLQTVPSYIKENSSFYQKCRQRVQKAGEPPVNLIEELSKKGERLEKLSKQIDEEKDKVKMRFQEIRMTMIQIIGQKEKECLELLDKEVLGLSEAYLKYEKLLFMGWPKLSDIQNIYPGTAVLEQRMSKIEDLDQLRAFMAGIQQDIHIQNEYFKDEYGLLRIEKAAEQLVSILSMAETSLPKVKSDIMKADFLESLMKDLMEKFIQQEVHVENSIVSRITSMTSKIISHGQFEILKEWLPKSYRFAPKLLFRASVDGLSPKAFHEKCDNKGDTITLVKCQFDGAGYSSIIGGFLDQSWHSEGRYSSSNEAFLFSLGEESSNSVKCEILDGVGFYGGESWGPIFGSGNDLCIQSNFKIGSISPKSYSNAIALRQGNGNKFAIEEVEVFQVQ